MKSVSASAIVYDAVKFQLSLIEGVILNLHLKDDQDITISDVALYYDQAVMKLPKKKYPVLHTFGLGCTMDHDVREFAAKNEKRISIADAVVITNIAHRLLARFYIKFHKPRIPTAIFNNRNDALDWLQTFL